VLIGDETPAAHVVERHPLAADAARRLAPWWSGL
jgi:hypothetical protein